MKVLVVFFYSFDDINSLGNRGFLDLYGLKTALKSAVLLYILPVFLESGRANHTNLTSGESRLQQVRGTHTAIRGLTSTRDIVNLVYHKNNISRLLYLLEKCKDSRFELTSELRSRNKRGEIQHPDLKACKSLRNFSFDYSDRQFFRNSSLTYAGFTYKAWVVLLSTTKNLYNSIYLAVSSNYSVNSSLRCLLIQISAVEIQRFLCALLRSSLTARSVLALFLLRKSENFPKIHSW